MKTAVIGGGAAGFFAAVTAKEKHPAADVTVFEKTPKVLVKVGISGGGRCNLTNNCGTIEELSRGYPRGRNHLKKAFQRFGNRDTMQWFESRGVPLATEDDGCVFPASQNSQSIIDCLRREASRLGVTVHTGRGVAAMEPKKQQWQLFFSPDTAAPELFDNVIVTTGGQPDGKDLEWLRVLGHEIADPVPSLFSFNMPDDPVTGLMGVAVPRVTAAIQGTKLSAEGPLLITHWGMSGPAILKLSSFGARYLHEHSYRGTIRINWANLRDEDAVRDVLNCGARSRPDQLLANNRPFSLPERLWTHLLGKCALRPETRWRELGNKGFNAMIRILTNDPYVIDGRTTFREEYVTCGGVGLKSVDMKNMRSRLYPNLYFAGEILDIDGITGGYNLQAAWTTGYIAGHLGL